ncbi:hypothetical protein [Roseivivax sediminis]|nr:hypothetical protein [Roseivivax sediminis]
MILVFAVGISAYALVSPRQSPEPRLGAPDTVEGQPPTIVEGTIQSGLEADAGIGISDLLEALVRHAFEDLKGPALDSYIAIIGNPSFRLMQCLVPNSAVATQYELKRRVASLQNVLSGPIIGDQRALGIDFAEVSPSALQPSTLVVMNHQRREACSWPVWLTALQVSIVLVAIFLAIYLVHGGIVGQMSFVGLAISVVAIGGCYVFLVSDRWASHNSTRVEILKALKQDEEAIIAEIRENLRGRPLLIGGGQTGTPSERLR